jgi:thymidine kinase
MRSLKIWTGPVASEKTTRALRRARRLLRHGYDIPWVIRPTKSVRKHEKDEDGKCLGSLVTKAGERYPSFECETVQELLAAAENCDAVWIDEPMLFDEEPGVFDAVVKLRKTKPILLSGLSADSDLSPFKTSFPRLISIADRVEFCRGDCDGCATLGIATRSICLTGKDVQVLVGGEETYRPLCPKCWTKWTDGDVSSMLFIAAASGAGSR